MDNKFKKPRSRFPKIYGIVIAVLTLSLLITIPAFAVRQTNLVLTADTQRGASFDVLASATSSAPSSSGGSSGGGGDSSGSSTVTKPKKPKLKAESAYAISKVAAIQLAKDNLQADDTWTVSEAKLKLDGKTPVYSIVLTDPAGDAHLRLVNADTGEITVRSLWKAPASPKQKNSGDNTQGSQPTLTNSAPKNDDRDENRRENEREDEREDDDD